MDSISLRTSSSSDGEDLLTFLCLGELITQLLLRPLLHVHIIVIFQLPVVILADAGSLCRIGLYGSFFWNSRKNECEAEDEGPQLADNNFRQTHGQLKS